MEPKLDQTTWILEASPELSQDEEIILVKAAQQDPAAFAPLYRQYVRPVYRYLYSRIGQVGDAEDLTAQVFLEAIEGLKRYRHNGPFAAWLFTIARRRAIDRIRRQRPLITFSEQAGLADASTDPLAQVIQGEAFQQLRSQLGGLRESDQELLRLRFAAGLGFGEIACILRCSQAAVKMNIYRLLRRLESQLEKSHE